MSRLDALPPDQRAVVALLLQQGRSYDDIASMLGMPVSAVRARAHAGMAALGPDSGLPREVTGLVADYLLGQQSVEHSEATRGLLAESASAQAWAAEVSRALAPEAPGGLPEVPGKQPGEDRSTDAGEASTARDRGGAPAGSAADAGEGPTAGLPEGAQAGVAAAATAGHADAGDPAAAAAAGQDFAGPTAAAQAESAAASTPEPAQAAPPPAVPTDRRRPAPPPSSRLGGAVLIAGVIAVVAVVLIFVVRGGSGGDEGSNAPTATATATPTATTATAQVTDQIDLRAVGDSKARGRMTVFLQSNRLFFQLRARNVPPSGSRTAYAVWFTGPGTRARRLGFTDPVGAERTFGPPGPSDKTPGTLGIQGPSDKDLATFPRLYADYAFVVVSRETDTSAARPADPILRGPLPKGR
jgi:hypothetical protein